ncbi:MAG: AbrB/MazE/SpoVT family DNA-binding domain-containing protein [Acidobacteria bacterium]|nr:AbrB/MazE/SpoVT family DNA-binding domain-containing protein [Acidobacteriota bacterium]MYD70592.1 AbrB/MazE/SpoVT family DNA-binding domain-containing protein [Acidobacteriota bacterium]MYJ05702.1 AbrB/MazE/SpoVT family DNA-binding domain-containing protein [Acidobacteriota bacterium]
METRIGKWGNSLALRIPQSVAASMGITLNATVELTSRGEQLVISVLDRSPATLDDLLARVTEDNLHGEVETGSPVGGEAW